ncbi:MAG: SDR family oxidoreductase [Proteobacteria bacterium]|nr:SDR family oxidoreductase [Pseudomonadota bacterium]
MIKSIEEMFSLAGRVVILTGGAGMLGHQYTRVLLLAGARVVVADIRVEIAKQVAHQAIEEVDGEAFGLGVDVSSKDEVTQMIDEVLKRWGRIDILINNAAIDPKFDAKVANLQTYNFEDYPLKLWQRSLDVNLTGAFLCAQAVGKVMVRQGGGVIVNICSTYGLVAPDQRLYKQAEEAEQTLFKPADYAVTKAGIAQLARYLAAYWGDKNIRVNTLTPGGVYNAKDDEFVCKYSARTPMGRMAEKDEMCGALLFLASDASSYMTGANLIVDGGWTTW